MARVDKIQTTSALYRLILSCGHSVIRIVRRMHEHKHLPDC
jgi:hypothetical protein